MGLTTHSTKARKMSTRLFVYSLDVDDYGKDDSGDRFKVRDGRALQ